MDAIESPSEASDRAVVAVVGDVQVVVHGNDVVAFGDEAAIQQIVSGLTGLPPEGSRSSALSPVALAGIGSALAMHAENAKYVEFSAKTLSALKTAATTSAGHGFSSGTLRNAANNAFAHNVQWRFVDLGPQKALAMQTAMTSMALQMAIHNVEVAVERVEAKVDEIHKMLQAEQVGDVVGRQRFLQAQAQLYRETGSVSQTDWASIAPLAADLQADLARLRNYVGRTLTAAQSTARADDRADSAHELVGLHEQLDLITLTEHSIYLFDELRLAYIHAHEPDALDAAVDAARRALASERASDVQLLAGLRATGELLTRVRPSEYARLISRHQLEASVEDLNSLLVDFATSRSLEVDAVPATVQPTLDEATEEAKRLAKVARDETIGLAKHTSGLVRDRLHQHGHHSESPAIGPGEPVQRPDSPPPSTI